MDLHKPKAIHNWREFLKEFATIVLGVSVALAAEQGVEWWHWRNQVAQSREVIATEVATDLRLAMWRVRTEACGEHRLDELAAIVDAASKSGTLPPVGDPGTPPRGYWLSGAWESVVASQAATHFPRRELAALTTAYKMIQKVEEYSMLEINQWNTIYSMVGPGRRLDASSDSRLRDAISNARGINRLMTVIASQAIEQIKALDLPYSADDRVIIAQGNDTSFPNARRTVAMIGYNPGAICASMGVAPAAYGQALWSFVGDNADKSVKALPRFNGGAH